MVLCLPIVRHLSQLQLLSWLHMSAAMSAECKMGAQRLLLCFVFVCVIVASVDALLGDGDEAESFIRCAHDVNEQV